MIKIYSRVQLLTDKYEVDGGHFGMIGYVIETYPGGKYEVEFSNEDGTTIAQLVVDETELAAVPEKPVNS
jgi:Domain of unknown function (DUF4926)